MPSLKHKEAADQEPAWQGAGQVVEVPKKDCGQFSNGDSYIVLNTYSKDNKLKHGVHFWVGKYSTQGEYGTASYKTVELGTKLDDRPVQRREVMGVESSLFKSCFDNIVMVKGGVDSGFRKVEPDHQTVRLFEVKKDGKNTTVMVSAKRGNSKSENVYIVDVPGSKVYQWNGAKATHDVKYKAAHEVNRLRDAKLRSVPSEVVEESKIGKRSPSIAGSQGRRSEQKSFGRRKAAKQDVAFVRWQRFSGVERIWGRSSPVW